MFRIAVVDDNLEYAQFVKKKIHEILYREKVVCDVEVFDKPMAFLCEVLEEDAFDVCFLDIEMPSMNGLELGRQLRKFGNRIIIAARSCARSPWRRCRHRQPPRSCP